MKITAIAVPAAALVIGFAVGATMNSEPADPVVRTVSVPRTPQSCLAALNLADRLLDEARVGFVAVSEGNLPRMKVAATNVNEAAPMYARAKTECKEAAKG